MNRDDRWNARDWCFISIGLGVGYGLILLVAWVLDPLLGNEPGHSANHLLPWTWAIWNSTFASWVQGLGTIAAVLLTARLANRRERHAEKERVARVGVETIKYISLHGADINRLDEQVKRAYDAIVAAAPSQHNQQFEVRGNSNLMEAALRDVTSLLPATEIDVWIAQMTASVVVASKSANDRWSSSDPLTLGTPPTGSWRCSATYYANLSEAFFDLHRVVRKLREAINEYWLKQHSADEKTSTNI